VAPLLPAPPPRPPPFPSTTLFRSGAASAGDHLRGGQRAVGLGEKVPYLVVEHKTDHTAQCKGYRRLGQAAAQLTQVVHEGHPGRSEEHTSELQSRFDLVCRLLREK